MSYSSFGGTSVRGMFLDSQGLFLIETNDERTGLLFPRVDLDGGDIDRVSLSYFPHGLSVAF